MAALLILPFEYLAHIDHNNFPTHYCNSVDTSSTRRKPKRSKNNTRVSTLMRDVASAVAIAVADSRDLLRRGTLLFFFFFFFLRLRSLF